MEGADEIGEIAEADVIGDVGDGDVLVSQQPRGMPQARAHQILMRGDAEHAGEQSQEMEWAEAHLPRSLLQIDVSLRIVVDPQRSFHRAPAVAHGRRCLPARLARGDVDETSGQDVTDFVEAEIAMSELITPEIHRARTGPWTRVKQFAAYFVMAVLDYNVTRRLNFGPQPRRRS